MKKNIANIITFSRILLIPWVIGFFLTGKVPIATFLFAVAATTDGLDGYLARYFEQTSSLGAWLDPVADKLIVASTLVLLLADNQFQGLTIPAIIIICREVIISALREWMAILGKQHTLRVSSLGKWKTAFQMLSLFLFLLAKSYSSSAFLPRMAYGALYTATLLTFISLSQYLWSAWRGVARKDNGAQK